MTPLNELRRLEATTRQLKIERLKPRRLRRQEERDRLRAAKVSTQK